MLAFTPSSFLAPAHPVSSSFISHNTLRKPTAAVPRTLSRRAFPVAELSNDDSGIDVDELTIKMKDATSNLLQDVKERPGFYGGATGLFVAAILAIQVSSSILAAIDSFPVLPEALQLIGLVYSGWFIWRYLLFKETRESFLDNVKKVIESTK